jgi:hypothetical protein
VSEEGFGRIPTEGLKALARLKLQKHPAILKQFENLPDEYLPLTSANIDKIIMYWELLTDALAEE